MVFWWTVVPIFTKQNGNKRQTLVEEPDSSLWLYWRYNRYFYLFIAPHDHFCALKNLEVGIRNRQMLIKLPVECTYINAVFALTGAYPRRGWFWNIWRAVCCLGGEKVILTLVIYALIPAATLRVGFADIRSSLTFVLCNFFVQR